RHDLILWNEPDQVIFRIPATGQRRARSGQCRNFDELPSIHLVCSDFDLMLLFCLHSPPRRGGVARSAGVVSSAQFLSSAQCPNSDKSSSRSKLPSAYGNQYKIPLYDPQPAAPLSSGSNPRGTSSSPPSLEYAARY